nr:glutathione S-transferase theta-1-like [Pongo pygmaeus]
MNFLPSRLYPAEQLLPDSGSSRFVHRIGAGSPQPQQAGMTLQTVELAWGEHLKPEFLKVNPLGKVPALRDGDFLLAESLCSSDAEAGPRGTFGLKLEAATWLQPEPAGAAQVGKGSQSLLPHFLGQPVDAAQLEPLLGRLMPALQHLDGEVLVAKPFLAIEQISLEDLVLMEVMQPTAVGCDLFQDWPRLAAWRARVEAAHGTELFLEAHKLILQPLNHSESQQDPQLAQKQVQLLQEWLR